MSSKLIFLILSTLLLAQWSVCKPLSDDTTTAVPDGQDIHPEYESENSVDEEELDGLVVEALDTLLSILIGSVKNMCENVVADINLVANEKNYEAFTAKATELTDIIGNLDIVLQIENPFGKVLAFDTVMREIEVFTSALDEKIYEDSVILTSLMEAGAEQKHAVIDNINKACAKLQHLPPLENSIQDDLKLYIGKCRNSESLKNED